MSGRRKPQIPAPYRGGGGASLVRPGVAPDAPTVRMPVDADGVLVPLVRLPRCQRLDAQGNPCAAPCKRVESDRTVYPVWVHVSVTAWFNDPHTAEV